MRHPFFYHLRLMKLRMQMQLHLQPQLERLILAMALMASLGCNDFSSQTASATDSSSGSVVNATPTPAPSTTPGPGSPRGGPQFASVPAPGGRALSVGTGQAYATLTAAVAASVNGDTIQVQPGTYTNDFPSTITQDLTIEGLGGLAVFVMTESVPNEKAMLVIDANVTLYNLDISGAATTNDAGANAAAIRFETGSLAIFNCWFHDNQNGMLGSPLTGTVTIVNSEFSNNGVSDPNLTSGYGYTHNLYLGVQNLTVTNSYFFAANVGHELKSRSLNTTIKNCVFADGANGTGSYSIDLPNGGNAMIENNLIEKGPYAGNPTMIVTGEEGNLHSPSSLTVSNNLFLNDLGTFTLAVRNDIGVTGQITGNQFYNLSAAQIDQGPNNLTGNTFISTEPHVLASWTVMMPTPWPAN